MSDSKEFHVSEEVVGNDRTLRVDFKNRDKKILEKDKKKLEKLNRLINND